MRETEKAIMTRHAGHRIAAVHTSQTRTPGVLADDTRTEPAVREAGWCVEVSCGVELSCVR